MQAKQKQDHQAIISKDANTVASAASLLPEMLGRW
jgi:hypothetical protein